MDRTNSNVRWLEASWSSNNDVLHSPAFLGASQASLCGWKSQTLSFPDIVYDIILDLGSASRVIQHFLHPNLFILPRFYETAILNVKTADSAALRPSGDSLSVLKSVTEMLQGRRGDSVPRNMEGRRSPSLRSEALPCLSKLVCWARSVRGGVRGVQEELGVRLHCGFALL